MNFCPVGKVSRTGRLGDPCNECYNLMAKSGCYSYGLGVTGTLAAMVPLLMIGAAITMHFPLTDKLSLETNAAKYDPNHDDELLAGG